MFKHAIAHVRIFYRRRERKAQMSIYNIKKEEGENTNAHL